MDGTIPIPNFIEYEDTDNPCNENVGTVPFPDFLPNEDQQYDRNESDGWQGIDLDGMPLGSLGFGGYSDTFNEPGFDVNSCQGGTDETLQYLFPELYENDASSYQGNIRVGYPVNERAPDRSASNDHSRTSTPRQTSWSQASSPVTAADREEPGNDFSDIANLEYN